MKVKNNLLKGASGDAFLLTFVKLVTMLLSLVVTRLLSEHLSVYDYGTYSQILLIISTVSSVTILGMMDGVNFFYCGESDSEKKEAYIVTIFTVQCFIGVIAGCGIMLSGSLICKYFDNYDIKKLLVFSAVLPVIQNLLGMSQILLVSVGKAKLLAVRNFIVSLVRLLAVVIVITIVNDVSVVFIATLVLDLAQIVFFWLILRKNGCRFRITAFDIGLLGKILHYCIPMAVFVAVNSLNRDIDKYLISMMTDTETLAVYTNASKPLPFDIIMLSFCTVLIPVITKMISEEKKKEAAELYKKFLEITYVSTGVFCCAAISAAPQLMELLYSEKYESGLEIFIIYILVDLLRFTNITLILSAAGKTKWLMIMGTSALVGNVLLNVLMYNLLGVIGPAIATLVITALLGAVMLKTSAGVLDSELKKFFDFKHLLIFFCESIVAVFLLSCFRIWLQEHINNYFVELIIICGMYFCCMGLLQGKRLFGSMKLINRISKT